MVPLPQAPAAAEPAEPEPTPAKPRAPPKVVTKVVRVVEPPATTPQETFRMAMEAISHMARADKAARQTKYDTLVSRMVK